ncbi:MAG: hypothetical protein CMM77_04485 [Rhodospirillaceae bacterium]|nr:hypothetical protein [Magnetovibrio sp.]MAY66365.1 hypothetical protein [Rhodospirillaceae bacterium]
MAADTVLNIAALIALLPALLAAWKGDAGQPQPRFWILLAVAVAGPVAWTVAAATAVADWRTDLSFALWVSVSASMAVFASAAVFDRDVVRLSPLFLTLMTVLAGFAMFSHGATTAAPMTMAPGDGGWLWFHIGVSIATYALLTVAAAASLAALLQERALKRKTPLKSPQGLPSVLDCEGVVVRFLWLSAAVLALGMATGTAINLTHGMPILHLDHKTVFAIAAFAVICALLFAHQKTGARGRQVARLVLLAYLFVTLAYPGVKFVTSLLQA